MDDPLLREAPKLNRENTRIQAQRSTAEHTRNLIRGLCPYPGAYGTYAPLGVPAGSEQDASPYLIKFFKAIHADADALEHGPSESAQLSPGDLLITDAKILLECLDGRLEILELQLPGKKRMEAAALLKGWRMRGIFRPVINNSL